MYPLNDEEFKYISKTVYDYAKINLTEKKRALIVSRLSKRIRFLKLNGFSEYIDYLQNDHTGNEFQNMVDSLSTNFSLFFREPHHFDFLKSTVFKVLEKKELNIWSAASSTGKEIYSIIMTIREYESQNGLKLKYNLFASDISRQVLEEASKGVYPLSDVEKVPKEILKKYFLRGTGDSSDMVKIKKELIRKIKFFLLNLMDKRYQLPAMDVIFLRNAIIYFDLETKKELIERLHSYIKPGGYLIIGHSESLSGISDKFKLIGKTIYKRVD